MLDGLCQMQRSRRRAVFFGKPLIFSGAAVMLLMIEKIDPSSESLDGGAVRRP